MGRKEVLMTRNDNIPSFLWLAAFGASLPLLAGCDTLQGSGVPREETRALPEFSGVSVSAGLEVRVSPGERDVHLRGDDNILDAVATEVVDGILVVRPLQDFDPVVPLEIRVRAPHIDRLRLGAGGLLEATGLDAATLDVRLEAGGTLRAAGSVERLTARLAAGGTLDASGVTSLDATVEGAGGGELRVTATRSVAGEIGSGTRAVVFGRPARREVSTSAGGSVDFP